MTTQIKADNTTTTENDNSDNKAAYNKATFGPLGKYAIIGVFMVSIIVTTAIMLDKQVSTVDEQIVAIEKEVAELNALNLNTTVTVDNTETTVSIADKPESNETPAPTEVTEVYVTPVDAQTIETPAADVFVSTQTITKETVSVTDIDSKQMPGSAEVAVIEPANTEKTAQIQQSQAVMDNKDQQWQARIEADKLEQKQHMSEMFARIKSLESQQLEKYKIQQDKQIERLREQNAKQQQMIETLVLRNKELFEVRAASTQRNQAQREQLLNRI